MLIFRKKLALLAILVIVSLFWGCSNFIRQRKLIISVKPEGAGAVTPSSGNMFDKGTTAYLEVEPSDGWAFIYWAGPDGHEVLEGKDGKWLLHMNKDKEIIAHFVEPGHETHLTSLEIADANDNPLPLKPQFRLGHRTYKVEATTNGGQGKVKFKLTPFNPNCTITINDVEIDNETYTDFYDISSGKNKFELEVRSEDNRSRELYTITIVGAPCV